MICALALGPLEGTKPLVVRAVPNRSPFAASRSIATFF
jgi:hypothetical protein